MQHTPNMYMPYGTPMHHEPMDQVSHKQQMQDFCKRYHHYFAQIETTDGNIYDGIIDGSDDESVYLLVPSGDSERDDENNRQYPFGGPPFDYGFPPRFPRRFRRFRRQRFPFFFLRRLFFPYFF